MIELIFCQPIDIGRLFNEFFENKLLDDFFSHILDIHRHSRAAGKGKIKKLFGSAEPMSSLYAVGPGRESLNHSIQGRSLDAQLDDIDRSSDPVQVSGVVPGATRAVAVVVGGKIVAVAPAASGRFWALVPRARLGAAKPLIYAIQARS